MVGRRQNLERIIMLIDLTLAFLAGLLIGLGIQKRRVIFVKEEIFDVNDPEVPEDVRAQFQLYKELGVWTKTVDEEEDHRG